MVDVIHDICLQYNLIALRDHCLSALGPKGALKVYVSSVGHLTLTNRSSRMLHALPVGDDVCVNYIKASAQKFVELYGNHGNLMVVVVSDLLASFSRFKPPILSQFGLRLSKAMNVALREQRQTIDFSHLQDMTNLVTTILGSKCSFPRKLLESASIDLLRAFLNSIPDPGEKPACMSWNRRVQIKAVVAQGDEIRLELGRYLHAFPEIYETPHWEPIQNCHILLMNIQLNLRDPCETVEFADLNCKTQRDFQSLANVMMVHMNRLISVCERLRVRIVINQRVVSRRIRGLFLKKGILLLERFGTEGIMAMQLVGNVASVLSTLNFHETLVPQCIGWIQSVDHVTLWRQDYLALSGRSSSNYSTLIVHHWNEETLEDIKISCDQALTTLRMMLSQPYVLPGGGCFEACLIKNLSQIPAQGPPLPCMESCLLDCVKMLTRICAVLARKKADDLWTDELLAHLWPEGDDTKSCICGQYEETPSRLIPLMSHYTMNRTPPKVELEISGMEGSSSVANPRVLPQLMDTWFDKEQMYMTSIQISSTLGSVEQLIIT